MIRRKLVASIRRKRLFVLVLSSCSIFCLTLLQLRAQFVALDVLGQAARDRVGPLPHNRRMLSEKTSGDDNVDEQIRYLAFGSASTSGAGLAESIDSYTVRVANSLSADLVNAASHGLALSAACTQTIVGDNDDFDVISIEFSVFDQNLEILARRLRQRYPAAEILLVELWNPLMLRYRENKHETFDFKTWRERRGNVNKALSSLDLSLEISASGPDKWFLYYPETARQRLQATVREINAQIVTLSEPGQHVMAVPDALRDYLSWFQQDDPAVLSSQGHAALAQLIHISVPGLNSMVPRRKTGSWGSGDHCNLWFSSGNLGSVDGTIVDFGHTDNSHKHAIEFRHLRGDSLRVYNPFDSERMLFLTYMTASEDGVYPRTRIRLNGVPTVQIDPFHEHVETEKEFARTTAVGLIPPNASTTVRLDPLQPSTLHFRLVGASLIAEEMRNVPIEFSLELESVQQSKPSWIFW